MYKTTTLFSLLIGLFLYPSLASAQMIWPGDINNNGIVNGVDYLYWGIANQASGPNRPGATAEWEEQAMGTPWSNSFPENSNYAYADVNGDGQINANDSELLATHFSRNHGVLTPDVYQASFSENATPLIFNISDTNVQSNELKEISFAMGNHVSHSLTDFYGLSFVLAYPAMALELDNGLSFGLYPDALLNEINNNIAVHIHNDPVNGQAEITMVRTDGLPISGQGKVGRFFFQFADLTAAGIPGQLEFEVINIMAIDIDMNPIEIRPAEFTFSYAGSGGTCPHYVDPVCGSNGVTYLNSCYAEAAGIYNYTEGTCFDDSCIDPAQMNPTTVCATVYEPVCGCNSITYANECSADAAGVMSTTPGPCSTNNNNCYDPQYVMASTSTDLNDNTGVLTTNCSLQYDPVCGCNGVTYTNAYIAEASGITVYTQGSCESSCIDPYQMDWNTECTTEYNPVCGCNGVTYTNPCRADAAGVINYTGGPCGGSSSWCEEAIPVQCGDFLPYETTIGAGNNITQYPGCSNSSFQGADRVYVIQKESAGDLQIGLEILTANLDLDMFLLSNNCSQITCLASSTTSNTVTNNEGIILEDAPIGTYYIVIDGQYPSSQGNFRLEVSCGYLYCGDAVNLQCGQSYNGNNMYGHDDVSLYYCDGPILNVENNGPEIVHTFTQTQAGPVSISLSGMSSNLELFLLRSCDRGDCIEFSQNSGNTNEYISSYLPAGTYYVVVDGYNGSISDYTLLVDCASSCDLAWTELSATSSGCGQTNGVIHISSSGGQPNYLINYSGPLSGSFTTSSNYCTISNLPPGTYTITKTDSQGCSITGTVTILGGGNLSANLTPHDAVCVSLGSIGVNISNGQAPYSVYLNGPTNGSVNVNSNNFTINDLEAGDYTIHITDYYGCSISQQLTIEQTSGNFIWNYQVTPASCGGYGAIHVDTYNGDYPFNIVVSGPVSGGATVYSSSFNLINLPGGVYQVTVEDGNWCSTTHTIVIPDANLNIDLNSTAGICGQNGSILVSISNGSGNYTINWSGPTNGSTTTNNNQYTLPNLPSGSYTISVEDDAGCTDTQTITVNNNGSGGLDFTIIPLPGTCDQNGALWVDIFNGSPIYTISWSGPESGILTTNNDGLDIPNLPCGTYQVIISDINGCSASQIIELGGCSSIDVDLTPTNGICGQDGSILVSINGGSPVYTVSWTGPSNGQTNTNTNVTNITGLSAGTYTINVTDANGCTDYAVTQISTIESNLVISTTMTEANCGNSGAIGINLSGGTGPYQISWSGPESGTITSIGSSAYIANLTAGTYQLYVTDANGCSDTKIVVITNQSSNLILSLVGNDGVCSQYGNIGAYITNGVGPYQITWSGPTNGNSTFSGTVFQIPNAIAGLYNVVVTDANGCSASDAVQINIQNTLNAYVTPFNGQCGTNGAIQVNISQGTPNYTISWSGPQNGSVNVASQQYTIPNLPQGSYTVVIIDANGCNRTLNTTIEHSNDGLDIVTSLIYNICGQYNTIWTDITGGTPPYTVTWVGTENGTGTTNGNGFEIIDLPPGTYKVTVVDAYGCMDMEQDIIIYPAPIDIFTVTPINGICGEDGSIQINITGGTGPFTLTWNGPVSGTQNYASTGVYTLSNMPTGTYTFTILDANWCTATETVTLYNGGSPVEIITALIYNECGQYNTIWTDIIGGTPPYSVTWTGTENGSGTTNGNGFEIMDLPPGTYKVTVVDANGCMTMEPGIIVYPAPINLFEATPINGLCGETGEININVINGTGPFVLTYSGPISGSQAVVFGQQVLSGFPSGTYILTLTDANGCTETETVIVNNNNGNPIVISTSLIYNECGQYNTIWTDITGGTPPYSVTWTGTENGSGMTSSNGFEIMDLPPGTYKVTVIDANGCMTMEPGIIVYPAPINLFEATPINGICSGLGSIQVNILEGTPIFNLSWSGAVSSSTSFNGNSYTIPNLPAGTYTLILTDINGCTEVEVVTVSTGEDNVFLLASPNNGTCISAASINVQAAGGNGSYTLNWSGPENGTTTIGTTAYVIDNLTPGFYTLNIIDTNGCDDTEQVSVSVQEDDLTISLTPHHGLCGTYGNIGVNIIGSQAPYSISWTGPSNGSSNINGQYINIPNLTAGIYTVQVIGNDGCSDTQSVQVIDQGDNIYVSATPNNGVCGNPGSINVNLSGGSSAYTLQWSGPINGSTTVAGNNFVIPNLPNGTYFIQANIGNCSDNTTVTINNGSNNINLTATPINGTCTSAASIHVQASGGTGNYTLVWSGPTNGNANIGTTAYVIDNLAPGTYSIYLTDGNGCQDIQQVNVYTQDNNLNINLTPHHSVCGSYGYIDVNISGGQALYSISWTGPSNGNNTTNGQYFNIPNLVAGFYTVQVTDINGCSDTEIVQVYDQSGNITVTASPINGVCGNNGSIGVTLSGASTYTLQWSGPQNGSTTVTGNTYVISNLPNGTYTIQANNGSCSDITTTTINSGGNNITIGATPLNGSCIASGSINVLLGGGVAPYQLSWQGPQDGLTIVNGNSYTINSLPEGLYTLTAIDANGCSRSTNVSLSDNNLDIGLVPQNGNCGDNASISLTINYGTAPYTISWTGLVEGFAVSESNSYTIQYLSAGTYQVTVQDANGCESTVVTTVTSVPSDIDFAFNVGNSGCGAFDNIWMDFYNGVLPYTIQWIGPASGSVTTYNDWYDIQNIPSGSYTVILSDANGCVHVEQVEVSNIVNNLDVEITPIPGSCGENGSIGVSVLGGEPSYTIAWYLGNQAIGEIDINSNYYSIPNLASGDYFIRITDENDCLQSAVVNLTNSSNSLYVTTSVTGPSCISAGSIGLIMNGGQAPYDISWSGPTISDNAIGNESYYIIGSLTGGTYQVTITDVNGCTTTFNIDVPGTTQGNPVANFDYTVDGLTVDFESLSSNDYHIWNLGDGTINYEHNPSHTFPGPGSYNVCLDISGSCGYDIHCMTIELSAEGEMAILDIGEASGAAGSIISLPVTLHNAENIVSIAGTIDVVNESVATILSVTPGVIAPQFNTINNTFSYFANGGDYVTFDDDDVLFYLNVLLTGSIGQTTLLEFANAPLPIEVGSYIAPSPVAIQVTTSTGSASITNMVALQGQLTTYWGDGIMDAAVTINGSNYNGTMMTNESGSYAMPSLAPGTSYTVSADKDIAHDNGLSTYALFIGQRFLLGLNPSQIVSPYQVIAGDANCNDAFTTLDLFLIQRLIIGAADEFSSCPSWVFVSDENDMPTDFDAYNVFPYASSSTMLLMETETVDFVGVKVGDILGQANPNNFGGNDDDRTDDVLPFRANNESVSAGEEVTLYFNSNDFEDIVSYQFGLQFSTSQVEFLSFETAEEAPFQTVVIGDSNAAEGKLRLSWFSLDGHGHSANDETTLFALRFRALTDITDWNEVLRIDPAEMLPEAYNGSELSLDPELTFGETITSVDNPLNRDFELYQNTPNPFNESTTVGFYLPESNDVILNLRDALGQVVWQKQAYYGPGEQQLVIEGKNLAAGVYYYTLQSGSKVATRSMVIVK